VSSIVPSKDMPVPVCGKCDQDVAAYLPSSTSVEHQCPTCGKWTFLCAEHGPHLDPGTLAFAAHVFKLCCAE
jgi:predicted RNA-binding Zn-ribbon protein involved in translation (DUF1610 family)